MKPIGQNPGIDASSASQPDGQDACQLRSPELKPKTKSSATARIEDIIAAVPVATRAKETRTHYDAVAADYLAKLANAVKQPATFERAQALVAAALVQSVGCQYVGWFQPAGDRIGESAKLRQLNHSATETPQALSHSLQTLANVASLKQILAVQMLPDNSACAVATPVAGADGQCLVVTFAVPNGAPNAAAVQFQKTTALELAASRLSEWLAGRKSIQASDDSRHVAALVELTSLVLSSESRKAAGQCLVDQLKQHLQASQVLFGACRHQSLKCQLAAVSGTPEVDRFSEATKIAEAVMQESIARSAASIWPAVEDSNRHALLSHKHFAEENKVTSVVACPLRNEAGDVVGCVIASFGTQVSTQPLSADDVTSARRLAEDGLRFLHAGTRSIGTAVHVVHRTTTGKISNWTSRLRKAASGQKALTAGIIAGIITAAMLIPVDYRVTCDSELQPVSPRYVAAPFDAPLDECLVHPGDVVEAGQILARLDGRELHWEQAGIKADLGKATKEHNAYLSEQEFGDAAIARHEIDRLRNRSAMLSNRDNELDIRSPISGIVVSGDLKDTEGVPLETGQSLFEIAPLDRLVIEVAIPEEDIRHVQEGMNLSVQLDAMPSQIVAATVLRIHPKAELRDHENVFIAEAELDNSEQLLRPGMKGAAKISTGHRALGWNLFHKPVAHVTGWLGW
ncbi:MAG: efflux RND transporter periplasmic adaptor subunit [Fuerstiella sp.]